MDQKVIIMMDDTNTHQLSPIQPISNPLLPQHHHQPQNDETSGQKEIHQEESGVDTNNDTSHLTNDQNNQSNEEDLQNDSSAMDQSMKTPNSYKYPLLKRYYEFGPWVGRNRKAICLGCRLQTSSSQPDRLLKHLNRCTALSESDKVVVQELMNERTANKRKKPMHLKLKNRDANDSTDYFSEGDHHGLNEDIALTSLNTSQNCIPARGERLRQADRSEKDSQIDEALTRFIMMCRIPLKAIHSQEFIGLCRVLNPDYHIPSRETITNVLIPGLLNII